MKTCHYALVRNRNLTHSRAMGERTEYVGAESRMNTREGTPRSRVRTSRISQWDRALPPRRSIRSPPPSNSFGYGLMNEPAFAGVRCARSGASGEGGTNQPIET
jgi:hypothetical protein